jgi:hypothetical protein
MSFADALEENRIPQRVGDIRLRYDEGRLIGESLPPSFERRLWPELCLVLAVLCGVGSITLLVLMPGTTLAPALLGLASAAFVGYAFRLEGRLGRRRFVLHFHTETLRLERLTWAPRAVRTRTVRFDDVTAVQVVQRPSGHYAIVVLWRTGEQEQRAVLVEQGHPSEGETLHRVWRMLHNAFGLKASAPESA